RDTSKFMKYFLQKSSFICCLIFVCFGADVYAQSPSRSKAFKAGESAFLSYKYIDAISHLNKVLAADSGDIAAVEMLADSYRQTKKYDQALHWYEKLSKHQPLKAEWALYYAEALAVDQQYEKSESWYRTYMRMMPSDRRASAFSRANPGAFSKDASFWKVSLTDLNTSASEY